MVPGFLTLRQVLRVTLGLLAAAFLASLFASPAGAVNTRVTITDFSWSKEPTIDLGESVTWDWVGPDLQHSITGQPPNATQWDSDPGNSNPRHKLGDSFTVTFDQPGKYLFICKLHPQAVRGYVTVTNQPGDPNSDPGPKPPINFDREPPLIEAVGIEHPVIGPKGKGTRLSLQSSEKGTASIDYYRLIRKKRRGGKVKQVRRFAGYHERSVHIGLNTVRFANRTANFKAKPGRYLARVRVDDPTGNASPTFKLRFEIKAKKKKKKKSKRRSR